MTCKQYLLKNWQTDRRSILRMTNADSIAVLTNQGEVMGFVVVAYYYDRQFPPAIDITMAQLPGCLPCNKIMGLTFHGRRRMLFLPPQYQSELPIPLPPLDVAQKWLERQFQL